MSAPMLDAAGLSRMVWTLNAALFFGVGVGLVWWPGSQTAQSLGNTARAYYDEASQNESEVRQGRRLHAIERGVAAELTRLSASERAGVATAGLLRLVASEASRYRVEVRSIVPSRVPDKAVSDQSGSSAIEPTALEITLRGKFSNVLAFISDLPRHDPLVEVQTASFSSAVRQAATPSLDVTLLATLFRFRGLASPEDHDVTPALR